RQWMQDRLPTSDRKSCLPRESDKILFARILLAHGQWDEALDLVSNQLEDAEESDRVLSRIELFLVRSKVLIAQGSLVEAGVSLKKSILLAEPAGYVSIFVNEGPSIADLLEKLIEENNDIPNAFANKLLTAFRLPKAVKIDSGYIERLSQRELEVLRLVAGGFSNKMIVEKLFISMSTVKTHLRNIYGKLNVNSRTQSIVKAKELDLL
ncbi:MAG: hypothetical protein GY866_20845, partial [Proteobacteria bacterium]|nr:hypothetical protein [Pseudomonadota bacterium]